MAALFSYLDTFIICVVFVVSQNKQTLFNFANKLGKELTLTLPILFPRAPLSKGALSSPCKASKLMQVVLRRMTAKRKAGGWDSFWLIFIVY